MSLSRREEQVLLAIWNLGDDAYMLSITNYLNEKTAMKWTIGSVQKPMLQLERKQYIKTEMGASTAKRGGRRKKMCQISPDGIAALKALKSEQEILWQDFMQAQPAGENGAA